MRDIALKTETWMPMERTHRGGVEGGVTGSRQGRWGMIRPKQPASRPSGPVYSMRVVVLVSGRGSNLEALLAADLPVRFAAVISNRPDAGALSIAEAHGIPTWVEDHTVHPSRASFDDALSGQIERHKPDLVVLAGFMRVLGDAFVRRYAGRMINIHPSLLPSFPGLRTHAQALEAGVRLHGATVHYVTPTLDHGPIIVQGAVPVLPADTPEALAARVLAVEHRIYPQAVRWIAQGAVRLGADGRVAFELPDARAAEAGAFIAPAPDGM